LTFADEAIWRFFASMKLWLRGAQQIVQVVDNGQQFLTKDAMKRLAILEAARPEEAGGGLSIIVDE
jgi:hypothetical protein